MCFVFSEEPNLIFRMPSLKPFFLILAFLLILSSSLPLVRGEPAEEQPQDEANQIKIKESSEDGLKLEWKDSSNYSFVLAAKRTKRKDPLNHWKYYRGGWDILNKHYITSVIFTAIPFFVIAALWFVIFGVFLLCKFICCICKCCLGKEKPFGYSQTAYVCYLSFLILFTVAAISGCAVLYVGQGRFHDSVEDTLEYIVEQGLKILNTLVSIMDYLKSAKSIVVNTDYLPPEVKDYIGNVEKTIDEFKNEPDIKSMENKEYVKGLVTPLRQSLISMASLLLVIIFLGLLLSLLGLRCCIYVLVVIGWIIITSTFIMCGMFLFLHNAVADTCVAMNEWVENPKAESALEELLPCWDEESSQTVVNTTRVVAEQIDKLVNGYLEHVANSDEKAPEGADQPDASKTVYYNQSGPHVPLLCDPEVQCPNDKVTVGNAIEEWKKFVCQVSDKDEDVCTTQGRLTPSTYDQICMAANLSYGLHIHLPFVMSLTDCSFVRETFGNITYNYCPSLSKYTEWVYAGTVTVSAAVMFSIMFWLSYTSEKGQRKRTKKAIKSNQSQYPLMPTP